MAVRLSTHSAASGRAFISRVQLQPCRPIGVAFSTAHSITQKQFIGQETLQQRLSAGSTVCRATMGTAQQAAALVRPKQADYGVLCIRIISDYKYVAG